ncbi:hypothetical protein [Bradyrhizobium glycinis]
MQDIFAALLANAMDPNCSDLVRSEFVETHSPVATNRRS